MKQLIVLLAVMPILLLFVLQFSLQEQRHYRMTRAETLVGAACEQAKQDGCFTRKNKADLAAELGRLFGLPADDIQIEGTESVRHRINDPLETRRRGMIEYRVSVPLRQMMAGASLLGISERQNQGVYVMQGRLASERLTP